MIRRARADETDKTFDAKSDTSKTVSGSRIRFHFPGFDTIIFPFKTNFKGKCRQLGFPEHGSSSVIFRLNSGIITFYAGDLLL